MPSPSEYLAVLKASYDYEPQSEDEIAIKEDQVLLLVERVDEDWWKVKIKDATEDEVGLVPAAYVEKADHKSIVKAVYDYDASAPGELSMKEDEVLYVFDKDEDWLLVQSGNDDGKVGFVPGTYVEETEGGDETPAAAEEEEEEEPSQASQIVIPPSPPRPTSVYVDPADRVAQSVPALQADSIQTWAVSEVDKKGKKKKGTLGIGNGAIFFASESDKTPVQKWQTSDIESSRIDKSKHVHIEVGGASAISLHFNAGSKDTAEEIIEKLESSKRAASSSTKPARSTPSPPAEAANGEAKPKKNGISVHFASAPPSIISPREPSTAEGEEEYEHVEAEDEDDGMLRVTALYDFAADGEDELSVSEGERLILLERDGDEWWKVRNANGAEGVVPAQYVELDQAASAILDEADSFSSRAAEDAAKAARDAEEEEQREAEKREREAAAERQRETDRKRAESERRARAAKAAADAAEADRKRKEREHKEKEEEEEEEERQREAEAEKDRKRSASATRTPRTSSATTSKPPRSDSKASDDKASSPSKSRADGKTRPSPQRTRVWHDITGQFSVEAEFLAYANGKLRLHKVNGVVIEVPAAKMSPEDIKYVDRVTGKGKRQSSPGPPPGALSDDDEPLAVRRRSLQPEPKQPPKSTSPPKKAPPIDWFEFFLGAGCELDDCTRYASSFERDKMDASLLPDITEQTMRSLGLREGDIIRVTKAIAQRSGGTSSKKDDSAVRQQMLRDEELAKQLQAEENGGPALPRRQTNSSPAPNLFAAPGGQLKNNTRRGRPQGSKSTPPAVVDLNSITTASAQINRIGSPTAVLTTSPTSVQAPARPASAAPAAPVISGFDDDAWTNRPSSTKPITPTPPAIQPRAPSAPPAQAIAPPAPTPPPVPPVPAAVASTPVPAPAIATTASAPASIPSATSPTSPGNGLARTTTSDVFDQLARLSALKSQSPANQPVAVSPVTTVSPPPLGFQQGLGMGSSPVPMGQVQIQPTGFIPNNNGPRGPFAPVPHNQGLLQPLVPTTTGFGGFVPTRPASTPMSFQATGYQPSPQPSAFQPPQQPSFLSTPNNFGGPIAAQPTGYPNSGPLLSQPTGYASSPFGGGVSYNSAMNRPVGSLQQPAMTGFNPNFNQMSTPPPVPPLPPSLNNNSVNSTAPANVFAQMKAGTFGKDDAPQPSMKYDALRPQPTGWGTFQNGFSGQYY